MASWTWRIPDPGLLLRRQISEVASPSKLYSLLMDIIVRFARAGLIHGDYNEFNILIRKDSGEDRLSPNGQHIA